MKTSKILTEAANLIEKHGWVQGKYGNQECGFCASGAIWAGANAASEAAARAAAAPAGAAAATAAAAARAAAATVVVAAATAAGKAAGAYIVEYNDKPGRTKEEVLAVLRKAAQTEADNGR